MCSNADLSFGFLQPATSGQTVLRFAQLSCENNSQFFFHLLLKKGAWGKA